ncbi:MAG: 1-(5-phosphoribosyl)-5-[(5-phosphoribosylamino)methylideneamino] imidazole-4-carboxamide isomerase [Bacteroidota bacterium]
MRIIPAIDIIDGKCVRLSKGDYNTKKVYNEHPLEIAKQFEDYGIQYLHLVDLDGAKSKHIVNQKVLEQIASKTDLKIDFGGGLKTDEDLRIAFESGAQQITGGSIAVKDPETFYSWLRTYGKQKIILGADVKGEKIAVSGWQEASEMNLIPFVKGFQKKGGCYVICTDIAKDGMLEGPAFELYRKLLRETMVHRTEIGPSGVEDFEEIGIRLIASGGISTYEELPKLQQIGCEGVIIGKAIYENRISLKQLEHHILEHGTA